MKLFNNNKSVFDKINDYLTKRGHELVMSIYLNEYNGNNIYIRFDFIRKLSVYKIVWVDLNFFDEKDMESYINVQMVTKYLSIKIVEKMAAIEHSGGHEFNDSIRGDRVEILTYFADASKEFIFDRFLPMEWDFLIDPLVLIFSYLPRGMDVFLNEMYARFDGTVEHYNYLKPVKFNLLKDEIDPLFKKHVIVRGKKLYEEGAVTFLEKFEDNYYAVVDSEEEKHLVILKKVDDDYVMLLCNCKCDFYCKHTYAAILALRNKKFNNFYKVKYSGREESLLEMVTSGYFHMSCGYEDDKILLVSTEGNIMPADIMQKGKAVFEVIEDDDECSLSNKIKELKK